MSRSADPGHFFQTADALSNSARKAEKSKNTAGNPIKLASKINAVVPDPSRLGTVFVAESAGTVRRVVLETGDSSEAFVGPAAPLTSVTTHSYRSDGVQKTLVFAGCWDRTVWSWDLHTRNVHRKYVGHSDFVNCVLAFPFTAGNLLLSGGADKQIIVWDMSTGSARNKVPYPSKVQDLVLDGQASTMNSIAVWTAGSDPQIRKKKISVADDSTTVDDEDTSITQHDTSVYKLRFDDDGDLWTASADKSSKCLSSQQNWAADTTLNHPDFVRDVVIHEKTGHVITACRDEEIRVWERASGKLIHTFSGHFEEVTGLLLLDDLLVSVSIDATVRQWSLKPADLQKAIQEAAAKKTEDAATKPKEETQGGMLTEEEEREFAELMEDDD